MHQAGLDWEWQQADAAMRSDRDGPVDIPFERFADAWIEAPIAARFEVVAAAHCGRIAVDDGTLRLTYGEVWQAVQRLAARVEALVPPRRPVGIVLPNGALFPVAALACLAAGRPYVPIDVKYPAARNKEVIRDSGMAAAIVDGSQPALPGIPVSLPQIDVAALSGDADPPEMSIAPAPGTAVILYTSGSTGRPKGICNEQRAILQRVAQFVNACHIDPADRIVLLSSPATIAGTRETFTALLTGATLKIVDPHARGVRGVIDACGDDRITICYTVPALLRSLLRAPGAKAAFAHMRIMRVGGDVMLESDLALCRATLPRSCHVLLGFGSTEVPTACYWFVPPNWAGDDLRLPLGYARPGVDFTIRRDDGAPASVGDIGELVVRSRYVALGHWRNGRVEPGPFVTDPNDPTMRIMRTGDLVRRREDGLWLLIGRTDRQMKIRGLRVDAGEVEAALRGSADVVDAAVIARRAGDEIVALVAYVVPRASADAGLVEELMRILAARVPKHLHPADIRFLDAIPKLPGFKPDIPELERIDKRELERRNAATQAAAVAATRGGGALPAASDAAEIRTAVEYAWTSMLDRASFLADLPWDEAGGDSLKAMQLWFYIEEMLQRRLPLDALDGRTTPSRLIAALAHDARSTANGEAKGDGAARTPLVFLMPGVAGDEPLLVRFRAALDGRVRFKLVDYPDWQQTVESRASLDAIIDAVVAQIDAEDGAGPYRLIGYSYGGYIAYEAARRLVASGRSVGWLGLLDSRRTHQMRRPSLGRYRRLIGEPGRVHIAALRSVLEALVRRRQFALLRAVARRVLSRPSAAAFTFHRHFIEKLRADALRQWRPVLLAVPTTLFLSDEPLPEGRPDCGWSDICRPLRLVPIGGTHASMMEPPYRERICAQLVEAVAGPPLDLSRLAR